MIKLFIGGQEVDLNQDEVNVTISNAETLTDNNRATDIEISFEITYPNKPTAQL